MKWKKIGDVLVLDKNQENLSREFLEELLKKHKVKSIVKIDHIEGQLRRPSVKFLIGDTSLTTHKENGCYFNLDLSKVMWSKGNVNERIRIAKLVNKGETVIDMFAGIGYFSIPIGVYSEASKIYSIELNPDSFKFLKENIILNKINKKAGYEKIKAILGDCREETPKLKADRILMAYVKTTHEFLPYAINSLNPGGILHYHETVPEKLLKTRPLERVKAASKNREVHLLNTTVIKKYSPGVVHCVLDLRID